MLGYVYVMSNEAMLGIYKIGCTSRNPDERANDLNTTGVPKPFVVEYCINIDNYVNIEKLVHNELSAYNFGKEFFKCDLEKCILTIKHVADRNSRYSEWYRNPQIKSEINIYEEQNLQKTCYHKENIIKNIEDEKELYEFDRVSRQTPTRNTTVNIQKIYGDTTKKQANNVSTDNGLYYYRRAGDPENTKPKSKPTDSSNINYYKRWQEAGEHK